MEEQKHANVAVFIPHAGCMHACSFCDQRKISGTQKPPSPDEVREILTKAAAGLKKAMKPAQIAFFGGSFTALDRDYMLSLLLAAEPFIDKETYSGIRVSTRPDAIDDEILDILKAYHVTDVELGAQSMNNTVLKANGRGHTAQDVVRAAKLIKAHGMKLGLQMMTGLYRDTTDISMETAREIAELSPDYVRVYPTLVLKGTKLEELYRKNRYTPRPLKMAVHLCADILELFTEKGIPVIRMGLQDSPELAENVVAGPYHPAFRELCESRVLLNRVLAQIKQKGVPKGRILIEVRKSSFSQMSGQNRANRRRLNQMGYIVKIGQNRSLGYLEVKVVRQKQ